MSFLISGPGYCGDLSVGSVLRFMWNTNAAAGASITRGTDGTVSVYKAADTTQSVAGVTDTEDFDGATGVHHCAIDTSADAAFYTSGADYNVVVTGAAIDSQTVNHCIATFSIVNRSTSSIGIRKNTAYASYQFFMAQAGDGVTAKLGLVNGDFTVKSVSIDGAAFTALSGTVTEIGLGLYVIDLAAAEVNGNMITLAFGGFNAAGAAATRFITFRTTA